MHAHQLRLFGLLEHTHHLRLFDLLEPGPQILEEWFLANIADPYPDGEVKARLAEAAGITVKQVGLLGLTLISMVMVMMMLRTFLPPPRTSSRVFACHITPNLNAPSAVGVCVLWKPARPVQEITPKGNAAARCACLEMPSRPAFTHPSHQLTPTPAAAPENAQKGQHPVARIRIQRQLTSLTAEATTSIKRMNGNCFYIERKKGRQAQNETSESAGS